ncbi:peptide chain release factor N(5)-glutamine methyltransferase [bacterium]|nr:peptide chain release factor N(5)-glutamine methyltransferase [bacterium]
MTILEIKNNTINKFQQAGFTQSVFETETLISEALGIDKSALIIKENKKLTKKEAKKINKWLKLRLKNYPLAYLTKEKTFYNLNFSVNKNTLIPRPESELFIDYLKEKNLSNYSIIDIGTGSGCLIITLFKNLKPEQKENTLFTGLDVSKKALKVAKKNNKKYNTVNNIKLLKSNLLNNKKISFKEENILIANLPYVSKEIYKKEKSIKKEPKLALIAKNNGLHYYKKLLNNLKDKINSNIYKDKRFEIIMEINDYQADILKDYIKKIHLNNEINIIKDLNNQQRLFILKIN